MVLSQQSATIMRDILENRITGMEVTDRDDMRELMGMKRCLFELAALAGTPDIREYEIDMEMPRRGRKRKLLQA